LQFHHAVMHASVWNEKLEPFTIPIEPRYKNQRVLMLDYPSLRRLIQLHPRAASIADRHGYLPFQLACAVGKVWDAAGGVRALYEAFSPAIWQWQQLLLTSPPLCCNVVDFELHRCACAAAFAHSLLFEI